MEHVFSKCFLFISEKKTVNVSTKMSNFHRQPEITNKSLSRHQAVPQSFFLIPCQILKSICINLCNSLSTGLFKNHAEDVLSTFFIVKNIGKLHITDKELKQDIAQIKENK